jgi:hypothetical protein
MIPLRALACVFGAAALAACAAAGPKPSLGPETKEPTTLEEAEAQLAGAKSQLEAARPAMGPAPTTTATMPAPPTSTAEPVAPTQEPTPNAGGGACVTPCRAIASMRRAVGAICRLAGETDAKCTDARRVLGESEARVAQCGC